MAPPRLLSRLSFLVAEDNTHTRMLMRQVLLMLGVRDIRESSDGKEALARIASRPPDVLLTDWHMEPMSGLDMVRALRVGADSPDRFLPVIMVTAYAERGRVLAARDAGVNEYLIKPFSARALYTRIQAVIFRPRPFVRTKSFFGPDRRRQDDILYTGAERRSADARVLRDARDFRYDQLQPLAASALGQSEVNAYFTPSEGMDDDDAAPDGAPA